jgi:hypothetical protein
MTTPTTHLHAWGKRYPRAWRLLDDFRARAGRDGLPEWPAWCYVPLAGAYAAVLGGLDGIVFGGGVGKHAPAVRARVLADMQWLGVRLDGAANAGTDTDARITHADSPCSAWVVRVDEAGELARAGQQLLAGMA